jgi:hypothetical protein
MEKQTRMKGVEAAKKLAACPSCHSPGLVRREIVGGGSHLVCLRCGYTGAAAMLPVPVVREHHDARHRVTVHHHAILHRRRESAFTSFLERFHLRLFLKVAGTMLLSLGVLLVPSLLYATGIVFLITGGVLLWGGLQTR